tara:strand:+ start:11680 stop:12294 length:615 start_codon:yes stop_codon:yes gene_type:complete
MNTVTYTHGKDSIIDKIDELLDKDRPKLLVFNKESDEFCGVIITNNEDEVDTTYYKHKKVKFDSDKQVWDGGNFKEGKLVDIDKVVVEISEETVNQQTNATIVDKYPWFKQSNIMVNVLEALIKKAKIKGEAVDEFNAMKDYIDTRRDLNERYKNAYIQDDSFKYVTIQEESNALNRRLAGGLHEKIGAKAQVIEATLKENNAS